VILPNSWNVNCFVGSLLLMRLLLALLVRLHANIQEQNQIKFIRLHLNQEGRLPRMKLRCRTNLNLESRTAIASSPGDAIVNGPCPSQERMG
jgi:hypothetical protein